LDFVGHFGALDNIYSDKGGSFLMNKEKIIGLVAGTIFIVFGVILIIQIILKLIGHSPSDIQMLYIGFGVIVSYLLLMSYTLGTFVGEVKEFMEVTKNSFAKLKEDRK